MLNGNPNEFIDTIYTCQDIVFICDKVKCWFQRYVVDGKVHMEVFQCEPATDEYIWEYNGQSLSKGQEAFQEAPIFNGR